MGSLGERSTVMHLSLANGSFIPSLYVTNKFANFDKCSDGKRRLVGGSG